jgi:GGDEF domain-containing protein
VGGFCKGILREVAQTGPVVQSHPERSPSGGVLASALPGGLLLLAWLWVNLPWLSREQLQSFLNVYPWVVLALGVLLGMRFRHGRVVCALFALVLAARVLGAFPLGTANPEAERFAFAAAAFLLPVNLAWLAVARENGTLTASGVRRLVAIGVQPPLVAFLWLSYHPALTALIERPLRASGSLVSAPLPVAAVGAFAIAFLVTSVVWARARSVLAAAFFWSTVGSLVALLASGLARETYLATAGLVLVIAVVESTFAMAYRDPLTGLAGRRAFDEALSKLAGRYTIAMVDIDHFKEVNDRYGHDVGDQVLRMLAARTAALSGARTFRVGGEEFAVLLPGRSRHETVVQLDAWRSTIADGDFALRGRNRPRRKPAQVTAGPVGTAKLRVTVSIGVAEHGGRLREAADVVRAADEALYRAKRSGRNQVHI